jgi:FtsH-binding integral membrane protein
MQTEAYTVNSDPNFLQKNVFNTKKSSMETERNDRHSFIRKTLAYFTMQMLITVILGILPTVSPAVRDGLRQYFWVGFIAMLVGLVLG